MNISPRRVRRRLRWIPFLILAVLVLAAFVFQSRRAQPALGANIAFATDTQTEGFQQAQPGTPIVLPTDHDAHPDFQTEWWYFTGNVADERGERWGYQFTIFRRALAPNAVERASDWAGNQVYLGHFAITDAAGNEHKAWERFSRAGADLAGAQAEPFRVWLEDWQVNEIAPDVFNLSAQTDDVDLDLTLSAMKQPILHGENGYSRKGAEPGNASYYYSYTRLQTEGEIRVGDEQSQVSGWSWMDHEWSTSALGEGQVGWDWFSIQLDNDWELMSFQLRNADGDIDPFSSGTLIGPDGETMNLGPDDFEIEVQDAWRSPEGGMRYPSGWSLRVPQADLSLDLQPLIQNQEMLLSTRYWEGAVEVRGEQGGRPVTGFGYVELTGYAGSMEGRF